MIVRSAGTVAVEPSTDRWVARRDGGRVVGFSFRILCVPRVCSEPLRALRRIPRQLPQRRMSGPTCFPLTAELSFDAAVTWQKDTRSLTLRTSCSRLPESPKPASADAHVGRYRTRHRLGWRRSFAHLMSRLDRVRIGALGRGRNSRVRSNGLVSRFLPGSTSPEDFRFRGDGWKVDIRVVAGSGR